MSIPSINSFESHLVTLPPQNTIQNLIPTYPKLKRFTALEPQVTEDLLIIIQEFLKLEFEFIVPGKEVIMAETDNEEAYFLVSDQIANTIFKFFRKDGPQFAYFKLQMEAYKSAFEYMTTSMLETNTDKDIEFYKEEILSLTTELAMQQKIFSDLEDQGTKLNIFTKPACISLKFLKRFAENFGKISKIVLDRVFYNLEVEATSILKKRYELKDTDREKIEKLKMESQPIIEKLTIVLPHHIIFSRRTKDGLQTKCNDYIQRLLTFLTNPQPEDPISLFKDYIELRQKESTDHCNAIIKLGYGYKQIIDAKTLVRHFKV